MAKQNEVPSVHKSVYFDAKLIARLEAKVGKKFRSAFINNALREALKDPENFKAPAVNPIHPRKNR